MADFETRAKKEIKYTDEGFVYLSRKWLARDLAAFPCAFTIYIHLLAWANYRDGALKRGQLALGERDFGQLLGGKSVITVRKWLRWLRDEGWIILEPTRWGKERGTIVTVIHYDASQRHSTYKFTDDFQEKLLTPQSEDQLLILGASSQSEDQSLILGPTSEGKKLILNPPTEDQNMIPHIRIQKNTYQEDASRQKVSSGQDHIGREGVRLPADPIKSYGVAALDLELTNRAKENGKVGKSEECNIGA